jgi:hypothetical protein
MLVRILYLLSSTGFETACAFALAQNVIIVSVVSPWCRMTKNCKRNSCIPLKDKIILRGTPYQYYDVYTDFVCTTWLCTGRRYSEYSECTPTRMFYFSAMLLGVVL